MGDLCATQAVAKDMAEILGMRADGRHWAGMHDHLDALLDVWMSYEHHRAWEEVHRQREMREYEEATYVDLTADDMGGMRDKLMKLFAMEDAAE